MQWQAIQLIDILTWDVHTNRVEIHEVNFLFSSQICLDYFFFSPLEIEPENELKKVKCIIE